MRNNKHARSKPKCGIWAPARLTESDGLGNCQWYGANSALDFSSIARVEDPFFLTSTCSDTVTPKSSPFHPFLGDGLLKIGLKDPPAYLKW